MLSVKYVNTYNVYYVKYMDEIRISHDFCTIVELNRIRTGFVLSWNMIALQ